MPSRKTTVLVVDDDIRLIRMMRRILELEGYRLLTASSGESALSLLDEEAPELILLDIMMPNMDGYTLCRRIREFSPIPIIMVTAKGNEAEKVLGLDAGADDYVTKPFSAKELTARVRAVLRRTRLQGESAESTFRAGDLIIDFARHRVMRDGQEVKLTATEYKLLSYLTRHADRIVTPDQILENVWGEAYLGETHLLQVTMARLRQKLQDDARNPRYILTKSGIGYMMMKST